MSLTTIRTAIKSKLDTLTGTWKPIVEVFDYHTLNSAGFPYVTFEPSNLDSNFQDTCNNLRSYSFDIFIYQNILDENRQTALNVLTNVFDEIINAFDKDYTLWWIADGGVNAVWWDIGQLVDENGATLFANIKIIVNILYNVNL